MSFRVSRSSGIEPSRRRSLSQQRSDHAGVSSSLSDYRTPSSSVVSASRRPYPGSSSAASSSYYSPSLGASSSSYLRNGSQRSSPYISKYSNYDNGVTTAGLSLGGGASSSSSSWYPGGSNQSLNTLTTPSTSSLYRSHSLREQERKSRSRNRTAVANKIMAASTPAKRSQSCSSEKSEGYEVRLTVNWRCCFGLGMLRTFLVLLYNGCTGVYLFTVEQLLIDWIFGKLLISHVNDSQSGGEESRKARLADGQTSTGTTTQNNGEIDYKALYEATK